VLPSWVIVASAVTEGPGVIARSIHVSPLSSEYSSFVTATSSVAEKLTFTGPRYHGLRMPVYVGGSSVAAPSCGAVVSVVCATAGFPAAALMASAATDQAAARLILTLTLSSYPVESDVRVR